MMETTTDAPALTDAAVQMLLRQALADLNRKEIVSAEAALAQVLAERPEEADALQLKGVISRLQGRTEAAEQFYRRAIASNPNLPQAHHNLGNLLRALRRHDESAACQHEAIRLKPNYAEAHLNLGQALQNLGKLSEAEACYRQALRIQPNYLFARQCLGTVLNEQKRPAEAEKVLRASLALSERDPRQTAALLYNLGISLKQQYRYPEALDCLNRAMTLVPDLPSADYNRGNLLQHLGLLEEAVDSYRIAIGRDPLDTLAHYDLNQLLHRLERDDEFLRSYDEVASLFPEVGQLPLYKANFLLQRGDYDAARENYERAASLLTDNVTPHDGLALVFARTGDFDAAIREHEIAVKMEPENAHAWGNFSETLIRAREPARAVSAAETALKIAPRDQLALAMLGLALRSLGDAREGRLNDYETFVQVFEIEPPEGYSDTEAFNRDLNAYLDQLHHGRREFLNQTLRGGTQTLDSIFGAGHDLVDRLRARIDQAVETYIARMADDSDHPFLGRRAREFGYAGSWSSRLHDCGFHTNHFHPQGWISSAYYIAVPEAVEDADEKQGWIKFGEPAFDAGFEEPVRRAIKPVPGRLVLFPSYMWHGTVPFHSQQSRTTIAFDVVPK